MSHILLISFFNMMMLLALKTVSGLSWLNTFIKFGSFRFNAITDVWSSIQYCWRTHKYFPEVVSVHLRQPYQISKWPFKGRIWLQFTWLTKSVIEEEENVACRVSSFLFPIYHTTKSMVKLFGALPIEYINIHFFCCIPFSRLSIAPCCTPQHKWSFPVRNYQKDHTYVCT